MKLEDIEKEFLMGNTTPGRVAELRVVLSGKYSYATNQYEEVLLQKPSIWNEIRAKDDVKSDTAAERLWEATELGQQERHWKFQIRKIEKMMSAAKTLLDVKTTEAYNLT